MDRINGTKAALLTQAVTKHASFIPAMAASQPHTIQQSVTGVGGILKVTILSANPIITNVDFMTLMMCHS